MYAIVALLALVLAACNGAADEAADTETPGGTEAPADVQQVSQAAQQTLDEGSATFTFEADARGIAEPGAEDQPVGRDDDQDGGQDGEAQLSGDGAADFEADQRRISFPDAGLQIIVDGDQVYIGEDAPTGTDTQAEAGDTTATADGQWNRLELSELADPESDVPAEALLLVSDPLRQLSELSDEDAQVTDSAQEDVEGTSTTRYQLDVNVDAFEEGDSLAALAQRIGALRLDVGVWVDEEDRVRQLRVAPQDPQPGGADLPISTEPPGEPTPELEGDEGDEGQEGTDAGTTGGADEQAGEGTNEFEGDVDAPEAEDAPGADIAQQEIFFIMMSYSELGGDVEIQVPEEDQVTDVDAEEARELLQPLTAATTGTAGDGADTGTTGTDTDTDTDTDTTQPGTTGTDTTEVETTEPGTTGTDTDTGTATPGTAGTESPEPGATDADADTGTTDDADGEDLSRAGSAHSGVFS